MNVHLDYHSGQSCSEFFNNFTIKVSGGGSKRVRVSFRDKADRSRAYASFSLPREKAAQLAHAILASSAGIDQPIEFSMEEPKPKAETAAA